jgi:hypothetical protein
MNEKTRHPGKPFLLVSMVGLLSTLLLLAVFLSSNGAASGPVEASIQAIPTPIPPPFSTTPPDVSKIAVGDPDEEGYATITGVAGAVLPDAAVAVINLSSSIVMTATADAGGAFTATLYAPPGSWLLVKYDTDHDRIDTLWEQATTWEDVAHDYINPLPGATLYVGAPPPGDGRTQPFRSVGAFTSDESPGWAGGWLSGTLQVPPGGSSEELPVQPGQPVTLTARLLATSQAMSCTGSPTNTFITNVRLRYLFDADGSPDPWGIWFNSHLFTPTGLPIEHEADGEHLLVLSDHAFSALSCAGEHAVEASLLVTFTVPADLPDGRYLPEMFLGGQVPLDQSARFVAIWYHANDIYPLPILKVGNVVAPRIPWVLLGDYVVNGQRGVQAREDAGRFAMPTRTLYPPHRVVIPRLDERTGQPLAYRLEPGSPWLSSTDRRFPCPPEVPLALPSGQLIAEVHKPDGSVDQLGPMTITQSSVRTPTLPDGNPLHEGTGHIGDLYHLSTMNNAFAYVFDQYGSHTILVGGWVDDIYGNRYPIQGTYDVVVARVLDLDPAQLPTMPYEQGDTFAPGLHVFPPVPADVTVQLVQLPYSDRDLAITSTVTGRANRFGYFQPSAGTAITMTAPGEFRVDISAVYTAADGTLWAGFMTWGNVVEGPGAQIVAHGRRGMDYKSTVLTPTTWFENADLLALGTVGTENYYPYFSGDVHWGDETPDRPFKGESIHSIITLEDLTASGTVTGTTYDIIKLYYPRAHNNPRWPPDPFEGSVGLLKRLDIDEAPLFITTKSGMDAAVRPEDIDLWGYWYGSSERPDVRVHEILSEDGMGTAYWRFNDTYGYQIGEPADGDQPGDIKWEFGGVVFRTVTTTNPINEYAIYSSLWVMLPHDDPVGTRVTAPFRGANGTTIDGGPILTMTVGGEVQEIDVLFLPKGVRPGDVLEMGDTVSFSGHVGPPLDSRVEITITSPSGVPHSAILRANKIGWVYDPGFDFPADEAGRWTVDVFVEHDRPLAYAAAPTSHNTGTVMGTLGRYEFYVVAPGSLRLPAIAPQPGFIVWPGGEIEPIYIRGIIPAGASEVRYTIHDKGVVMGQGIVTPDASGVFTVTYDAEALHEDFSMLSLTAHEGRWEGLADEVTINLLAVGTDYPCANTVTLIGEEVFIGSDVLRHVYLPLALKE